MIKELFKDLPEGVAKALEKQLLEAIREADNLHKGPQPMHDIEAMKICAQIHVILDTTRKFNQILDEENAPPEE